jgi:hypothetical protein
MAKLNLVGCSIGSSPGDARAIDRISHDVKRVSLAFESIKNGRDINTVAANAQQPKRRIGVLMSLVENDPEGEARVPAFLDGLQQLRWAGGHNVRIEIRWTAGNPAEANKYAAELVALTPDVAVSHGRRNLHAVTNPSFQLHL